MNRIKTLLILVFLGFILFGCQQSQIPPRVNDPFDHYLWVGDDILEAGPLNLQTMLLLELAGYPGYTTIENWVDPRNTLSSPPDPTMLEKHMLDQNADFIFIQAFGVRHSFEDEEFLKNSKLWLSSIRKQDKQAVIFYPWFSEVDDPETINRLDKLVHEAAWSDGLVMIPVGPAWQLSRLKRPDIQLYASDGIHPSAAGVYLTACVIYSVITGQSPVGNPSNTSIGFDNPDKVESLDKAVVLSLQKLAWETIQDYLQKNEFQVLLVNQPEN
jgi:hypothetical protein